MAFAILGGGIALWVVALLSASACNSQSSLVRLVRAYQEAKNSQDLDALAQMYAEDAELELGGMGTVLGCEQICALDEYDVGINTRLEFSSCVQEGNSVVCDVTETNDWLDAAGLGANHYASSVFTFEQGLIVRISASLSPEPARAMEQILEAFTHWIAENHPEALPRLFTSDSRFIYSRENGVFVVGLLREWRAAAPAPIPTTSEASPNASYVRE